MTSPTPADIVLRHLCTVPQHRPAAAALIHNEFWAQVPGASAERMAARLATADDPARVPLALVALHDDRLVGAINLVASDDDSHPEWTPWMAGVVVAPGWRGRGIGSAMVTGLLPHAWRLGCERLYLGTDGPGFYQRLGAVVHQQVRPDFWFMRFDRGGG